MTSGCGAERAVTGRVLAPGDGRGGLLVLDAPVSFWGGVGADGTVVDRLHPQVGVRLAGRVVVMESGRGSSSSSSVLAEHIRAGVAPAALVLREPDVIVALGSLVAAELYGRRVPVVVLSAADHLALPREGSAVVTAGDDGAARVVVRPGSAG